jgi:O-antigen/teichoic acid export membrane protein
VIHLAFGPQWQAAVVLVQAFALVGAVKVVAAFSAVLLNAAGLIHVQFRILLGATLAKLALLLALVGAFGLAGAAAAAIGAMLLSEALSIGAVFRRFHLSLAGLAREVWRAIVAAGAMVLVLTGLGLGLAPARPAVWQNVETILSATVVGAGVYGGALLLLWLASGRPRGAETMLLDLVREALGRVLARRRRA